MGLGRRNAERHSNRMSVLSMLGPVVLLLAGVSAIIGVGAFVWDTVTTHESRIVDRAVEASTTITVMGEGAYREPEPTWTIVSTLAGSTPQETRDRAVEAALVLSSCGIASADITSAQAGDDPLMQTVTASADSHSVAGAALEAMKTVEGFVSAETTVHRADDAYSRNMAFAAAYEDALSRTGDIPDLFGNVGASRFLSLREVTTRFDEETLTTYATVELAVLLEMEG